MCFLPRCFNFCVVKLCSQISFGFCSHGFIDNLQLGGPTPIGARKAPLSEKYLSMMQEVALNEQVCLIHPSSEDTVAWHQMSPTRGIVGPSVCTHNYMLIAVLWQNHPCWFGVMPLCFFGVVVLFRLNL